MTVDKLAWFRGPFLVCVVVYIITPQTALDVRAPVTNTPVSRPLSTLHSLKVHVFPAKDLNVFRLYTTC
jgi:hypothetical protein